MANNLSNSHAHGIFFIQSNKSLYNSLQNCTLLGCWFELIFYLQIRKSLTIQSKKTRCFIGRPRKKTKKTFKTTKFWHKGHPGHFNSSIKAGPLPTINGVYNSTGKITPSFPCKKGLNKGQVVTPCIPTNKGPIDWYSPCIFWSLSHPSFSGRLTRRLCQASLPQPSKTIPQHLSSWFPFVLPKKTAKNHKKKNNSKNGSRRFGGASCFFHVESGSVVVFLYRKKSWVTSMVFVNPMSWVNVC